MVLIFSFALVLITILLLAVQKAYHSVPLIELKRRARAGDDTAKTLHRAAAYGPSLDVLLWLLISLSLSGFLTTLFRAAPVWLAFLSAALVLWLGFIWTAATHPSAWRTRLAYYLAGPLAWTLTKLHRPLDLLAHPLMRRMHKLPTHLYEKEDVLKLFSQQKHQPDSRLSGDELALINQALLFSDKLVNSVIIPLSKAKLVSANDNIGPILMDELHSSGQNVFAVYSGKRQHIVGTLGLADVLDNTTGKVKDIMHAPTISIDENQPLRCVLETSIKTQQQLFLVVNGHEEVAGVITLKDVLEELVGSLRVEEASNDPSSTALEE